MRPTKLSSKIFLELPPVLAHYLEGGRNVWLESLPGKGKLSLLNRPGIFTDLENLAVERKQLVEMLGPAHSRALRYRLGFEQGRRDAARHYAVYAQNARLALQAGPVFGQMQGRYVVEPVKFEFDLGERTLYRELVLQASAEGLSHRMAFEENKECACWTVAGYLSGQVSEIVGRHVVTLETECCARGDSACRFISRLETEWGSEADWVRQALQMGPLDLTASRHARGSEVPPPAPDTAVARQDNGHNGHHSEPQAIGLAPGAGEEAAPPHLHDEADPALEALVMDSHGMQAVAKRFRQLKHSDVPVLLVGEPGTGRQTLGRLLHGHGPRADKPFVVVDCQGLHDEHLTRELFGYGQGAFPGATRAHVGAMTRAHGGTVYLDEVTNLSLEAQGRLVRALEDKMLVPLGETEGVPCDVRLIAATQHDPLEKLNSGGMREDFYYILTVARVAIPPLRDRGTDILRLAERFLGASRVRYGKPGSRFGEDFKQVLMESAWPGNVRQLRNVIEHAVVMSDGEELRLDDVPEELLATKWKRPPHDLTEQVVRAALKRTNGNRSHAADLLGVGRTTLWRAMKRMGLE